MGNTSNRDRRSFSTSNDDTLKDDENWMKDVDENEGHPNLLPYSSAIEDRDFEPKPRVRANTLADIGHPDKRKLPTVFKWEGGGKNVSISGSFNNWKKKVPMVKSTADFYAIIDLPEGTHEYKFYVDGQWMCDQNELKTNPSSGVENNVVKVASSDFEVFEALAMDQIKSGQKHSDNNRHVSIDEGSITPPGEYSQEFPKKHSSSGQSHSGPPILPPHLLQVILNKKIPIQCEPTLLPEPNHVMLNHLYALSIKEGVMVLSATHRYQKKYVTTLLYKPI